MKKTAALLLFSILLLFPLLFNPAKGETPPNSTVISILTDIKRGGGFCVQRHNNYAYIMTAQHVIESGNNIFVCIHTKRGVIYKRAAVVYSVYNNVEDLAILKIEDKEKLVPPERFTNETPRGNVGSVYFNGYKIAYYKGELLTHKNILISFPAGEKGQSGAAIKSGGAVVGVVTSLDLNEKPKLLFSQSLTKSRIENILKEVEK